MPDIDLKTLTPDNNLPIDGLLFGADSQAVGTTSPSVYTTQAVATTLLGSTTLTGAPALAADAPVLNLSQTWSNIAVTFTGIKYNTTNTNSAAASLLMDLQVDTVSKFHITKNGSAHGTLIGSSTATFGISAATGIGFYSSNRVSVLADGQVAMLFGSNQNIVANGRSLAFESAASGAGDTFITRKNTRIIQLGAADAAAALAQTLSVQSVVGGTTDGAGQPFTITGSQGTGTGAGGSIVFQVAPAAGSTNTTQNALQTTFILPATGGEARVVHSTGGSAALSIASTANTNVTVGFRYSTATDGTGGTSAGLMGRISGNFGLFTAGGSLIIGQPSGSSSSVGLYGTDLLLTRKAAANLQLGSADAAAPLAQTLSVQSVVTGTSNTAGAAFTITGSQGTGSGTAGSMIFQIASSGSASTFTVTFTNGSATISGTGLPATAGTPVAFTTTGALPTNFAINTTYFVLAGSTSTAITVAATAGGTAIVAGSAGSGTQTLTQALAQHALQNVFLLPGTSGQATVINSIGGSGNITVASTSNTNVSTTFKHSTATDGTGGTNSGSVGRVSGNFGLFDGGASIVFAQPSGSSDSVSFYGTDCRLARDDANILAQRNGVNAQAFRVYNTYTDASNYERGVFDWTTTANTLTIGMQRAGTGTARGINFVDGGGTTRLNITAGTGIVTVAGVEISTSSSIAVFSAASAGYTFRYISGANSDMIIRFTGITSSFPALKRSTTSLQVRLADDTGFTNIQGKLTTDTAYTAGALVATGYITIYDSTGTAYRVPCLV